jgi:holo-[acyl-carrier protein] synthase
MDVVLVERFELAAKRTQLLTERLFTDAELKTASGNPRSPESLAARFAAKEAIAKALGAPAGLGWHDAEVIRENRGRPRFEIRGTVLVAADALGVRSVHVSLSHDGGLATAYVVLEG